MLQVSKRKDTGTLQIVGTLNLPDGSKIRVRQRTQAGTLVLAREEAATLEAQLLRDAWHGKRARVHTFGEALLSYLQAEPRTDARKATLARLRSHLAEMPLSEIDQDELIRLRGLVIHEDSGDRTFVAQIVEPITAVLNHAHVRGWCEAPHFSRPRQPEGRTRFLTPDEAERLVEAASPHLKPMIVFLLCTGARLSEALGLEWQDVDLKGGRATFWGDQTKSGRRRSARLPARCIVSMAALSRRDGRVFCSPSGQEYTTTRERGYGGQIKTSWATAIRRAGLGDDVTPHVLRHTWASWHYALNRDVLALKQEGGWSSVELVERYCHLLPVGHEDEIREFLNEYSTPAVQGVMR